MIRLWKLGATLLPIILLSGARVGGAAATIVILYLVLHQLGAETLGHFAVFIASSNILAVVLSAGYSSISPFFVASYRGQDKDGLSRGFLRTALGSTLLLGLVWIVAGSLFFISPVRDSFFPAITAWDFFWLTANSVGLCLSGLHCGAMAGLQAAWRGLVPESLLRPALTLFAVPAVIFLPIPADALETLFAISTVSTWVALGVGLWLGRRLYANIMAAAEDHESVRWRNAAFPWIPITLFWDYMVDIVLLVASFMANASEIALLHLCFRFRALAGYGMRSIYVVAMPRIMAAGAQNRQTEMERLTGSANMLAFCYAVAVVVAFALVGQHLIAFFNIEHDHAGLALALTATVLLGRSVFGPAPAVMTTNDLNTPLAAILFVAAMAAVLLVHPFHAAFGVFGVISVFVATNLLASFILYRHLKRRTGIDCSIFPAVRILSLRGARPGRTVGNVVLDVKGSQTATR